jgi:hypothetical protein
MRAGPGTAPPGLGAKCEAGAVPGQLIRALSQPIENAPFDVDLGLAVLVGKEALPNPSIIAELTVRQLGREHRLPTVKAACPTGCGTGMFV